MLNRFITLCALVCLHVSVAAYAKVVPATDAGYVYTGRIDFANASAPYLTWPGSSVKARFSGESLSVTLKDDNGKNYYNVIVDGNDAFPFVIEAKQGEHTYWISNTLGAGEHTVEIYKRTEGEEGGTHFLGISIDDDAALLAPPGRPTRRIEIYGDSISSGMGNVAPYNGPDNLPRDKNHYLSYGAIAARTLGAELHTISQSGIGIMVSWFNFIMPQFYDQLSAVGNNDSKWDFSTWTPQVVVINLMQNDSWLVPDPKRISPTPTEPQIIAAYQAFVKSVRAEYPNAQIICALGSMDATKAGSPWPGYVEAAVANLTNEGDNKLSTVVFPFNGYGQHPRVNQHTSNAELLTQAIQQATGWR